MRTIESNIILSAETFNIVHDKQLVRCLFDLYGRLGQFEELALFIFCRSRLYYSRKSAGQNRSQERKKGGAAREEGRRKWKAKEWRGTGKGKEAREGEKGKEGWRHGAQNQPGQGDLAPGEFEERRVERVAKA